VVVAVVAEHAPLDLDVLAALAMLVAARGHRAGGRGGRRARTTARSPSAAQLDPAPWRFSLPSPQRHAKR
jgi:hypothetical protein